MAKPNKVRGEDYLQAAQAILNRTSHFERQFTIEMIAKETRKTSQAFNAFWGSKDKYIRALLDYLMHVDRFWTIGVHEEVAALANADNRVDAFRSTSLPTSPKEISSRTKRP